MAMTVQQFKEKIRADVVKDPAKFIRPDLLQKVAINTLSQNAKVELTFTFAADEKIQEYLDGKMGPLSLCCIACVKILRDENCVHPHYGPCEPMCG